MVYLCLLLFLGFFLNSAKGATKTWKYTYDIMDPIYWEGGEPSNDCNGIIFPESLGSAGFVFEFNIEEILLPINGELEIQHGGHIQFVNNTICIKTKKLQHYYWLSPDSWHYGDNAAIPDAKKVPCDHDDVIFSPSSAVAVIYPEISTYINSVCLITD